MGKSYLLGKAQLALTYLVYPGATHRRFEHSLGVMELADRVFQIITAEENRDKRVGDIFPVGAQLTYWRRVLRMAALCHDIGHLPFSHAAEKELLPNGLTHEDLTVELIQSPEMEEIWKNVTPPLRSEDVVKIAVGPKAYKGDTFDLWERILAEIIVGDSFGVDRMDYLLRDSLHAGVVYGHFDQYRLIDTLRILPESDEKGAEPVLGIESGGRQSAEALLLARYFMFSQVYCHQVRRIYDIHLRDFLTAWFGKNNFPTELDKFLDITDNEVLVELRKAANNASHEGHDSARRIMNHEHFRLLYERNPADAEKNPESGEAVYNAACKKFGEEHFRHDRVLQKKSGTEFPVKTKAGDGKIESSLKLSDVLKNLPLVNVDYVFVSPEKLSDATEWLDKERNNIITAKEEGE